MNTAKSFLSPLDAAKLCGISVNTLVRFAESGYLKNSRNINGELFYLGTELVSLFGVKDESLYSQLKNEQGKIIDKPKLVNRIEVKQFSDQEELTKVSSSEAISKEISRLENLIALQEKLLEAKDAEITDLKLQRDWLQKRIERQEQKSERDQLLLISETQMLTKLMTMQSQKKSPVKLALEWIGYKPKE